jgi:hypothetical protein
MCITNVERTKNADQAPSRLGGLCARRHPLRLGLCKLRVIEIIWLRIEPRRQSRGVGQRRQAYDWGSAERSERYTQVA